MSRGPLRAAALIVGGGPAGAATALALARLGHAAVLIEASGYEGHRAGETLPPVAGALLRSAGVWERFLADGHAPSQAIESAWGGEAIEERHFLFQPFGTGWHLDRRRFDSMLASAAEERGATVLRAARLASLAREQGGFRARVAAASGDVDVEARFVVDATGRASAVSRSLGAERVAYDRLVGLVGVLDRPIGADPPRPVLLLEAFEQGWWYSVPLPDGSLLAAAMVDADEVARSGHRPSVFWQQALARTRATARRVAGFGGPAAVAVRKAGCERLTRVAGPGLLAVGDAATSHDPLSSQGICKALSTAERAAHAIAAQLDGQETSGIEYERYVLAELDAHRRQRLHFYGAERRWPEALFWQRRRPLDPRDTALTLDPHSVIRRGPGELPAVFAALEGTLPIGEGERLRGLCEAPAAAHEVVARFQRSAKIPIPDRDAIHAVQALLRTGALALAG